MIILTQRTMRGRRAFDILRFCGSLFCMFLPSIRLWRIQYSMLVRRRNTLAIATDMEPTCYPPPLLKQTVEGSNRLGGGLFDKLYVLFGKVFPQISDQQQSWGYEEGPSKGPGPRSAAGR